MHRLLADQSQLSPHTARRVIPKRVPIVRETGCSARVPPTRGPNPRTAAEETRSRGRAEGKRKSRGARGPPEWSGPGARISEEEWAGPTDEEGPRGEEAERQPAAASGQEEEEAAAAFWGPFSSQLPDLPTLRVCTYLPTYLPGNLPTYLPT